jgi:hypothetical protein
MTGLVRLFACLFVYLFTYLFIYLLSIHPPTHPCTLPHIHSSIHLLAECNVAQPHLTARIWSFISVSAGGREEGGREEGGKEEGGRGNCGYKSHGLNLTPLLYPLSLCWMKIQILFKSWNVAGSSLGSVARWLSKTVLLIALNMRGSLSHQTGHVQGNGVKTLTCHIPLVQILLTYFAKADRNTTA